ncbi:ABC transporter permease, partial [bacterium]|nr:ABC transporter permease [bacterium]
MYAFLIRAWLPVSLVLIWYAMSASGLVTPLLLPNPVDVATSAFSLSWSGELF